VMYSMAMKGLTIVIIADALEKLIAKASASVSVLMAGIKLVVCCLQSSYSKCVSVPVK
jgi:hypothetical protein